MKVSTYKNNLLVLGSVLAIIIIWHVAAVVVGKEILLPGPGLTGKSIFQIMGRESFWQHLSATLIRGIAGFSLSFLVGLVFGVLSGLNRKFEAFFQPWLVLLRSTPSMALILLALIWFKSDSVALFVTFLVVFPIITQNVSEGIQQIDPRLKEMALIYHVSPSRILRQMYLPAILPYIAAGGAAGLGLTWKVMIAAEVIANPRLGIGTQMDAARIFLQTPEVFAWTAVVVSIGLLFDRALEVFIRKKLLYWE
jgi:NitT/TauT family transport system permease protein